MRASARRVGDIVEVTVERLGRDGDGIARVDGRPLFLPSTLPGERLRARIVEDHREWRRGVALERLHSPPHPTPVCPHFGTCGGCRLQHLPETVYREFRLAQVTEELTRRRLVFPPPQFVAVPPASRRRLRLAWQRDKGLRLGFRRLRGHAVVDVASCPVARPELVGLFAPLRRFLSALAPAAKAGEALATLLAQGVDLLLWLPGPVGPGERERLARFAAEQDLARVAVATPGGTPEPVVVRRPPELAFGLLRVPFPPGAFLQATVEGEAVLAAAVAKAVPAGARLVDLFAGLGALSLPIAHRLARLHLVEGDAAAVDAVRRAVRARGANRIEVEARDLQRRPLVARELDRFDAAILDPPRGGAAAQVAEIAASAVPILVYASCNPATFARDLATLVASGFRLEEIQVVDQFLWSAEVELVARLERRHAHAPSCRVRGEAAGCP
ncbi:23S rRNA (uracil(1939)-C(5))-methyltransferase RlmD [bacterium HR40]|nr:23S rRNA (uracil(1939)-C(5))-methyltransferase RlmD [bacterium HR40]